MNKRLGCALSITFFLLSACRSLPRGQVIDTQAPLDPDTVRAEASPSWSRIGIKQNPDDPCPEPPVDSEWEVSQLFETRPPEPKPEFELKYARKDDPQDIPPGLRSFCLYRGGANLKLEDLDGLVRLDRDYMGVTGIADSDPGQIIIKEKLEKNFLVHSGEEGTDNHLATDPSPSVRLAILDTLPTGEGMPDGPGCGSQHGYSLAHLAQHLACTSSGECAAHIVTELALPQERFDRDSPKVCGDGGSIGTLGDLAAAVRRAVTSWRASDQDRLVINLSLGWNGALLGGLESDYPSCTDFDSTMEAAPLAVLCALKEAACRGAVVVAAAGNRNGGPESDSKKGPLLPAAWEQFKAPSYAECTEILGHHPDSRLYPEYKSSSPLVYAVGGVRHKGHRLVNSRPDAEPRLVAYADHAIVKDKGDTFDNMNVYTGTSVAALVVSATAAAVWSSHPELKSQEQLMNRLYESGYDLGRHADFPGAGPSGASPPEDVRWISLCRALRAGNADIDCTSGDPDSWKPPTIPDIPSIFPNHKATQASGFRKHHGIAECPAKKIYFKDRLPDNPCPFYQFHDVTARPWVAPQPFDPPTSSCSIAKGSCIITLKVSEQWAAHRPRRLLRDATLEIGNRSYAINQLKNVELVPGQLYAVRISNCKVTDTTPASLTFRFDHEGQIFSIEDPLMFLSIKDTSFFKDIRASD